MTEEDDPQPEKEKRPEGQEEEATRPFITKVIAPLSVCAFLSVCGLISVLVVGLLVVGSSSEKGPTEGEHEFDEYNLVKHLFSNVCLSGSFVGFLDPSVRMHSFRHLRTEWVQGVSEGLYNNN